MPPPRPRRSPRRRPAPRRRRRRRAPLDGLERWARVAPGPSGSRSSPTTTPRRERRRSASPRPRSRDASRPRASRSSAPSRRRRPRVPARVRPPSAPAPDRRRDRPRRVPPGPRPPPRVSRRARGGRVRGAGVPPDPAAPVPSSERSSNTSTPSPTPRARRSRSPRGRTARRSVSRGGGSPRARAAASRALSRRRARSDPAADRSACREGDDRPRKAPRRVRWLAVDAVDASGDVPVETPGFGRGGLLFSFGGERDERKKTPPGLKSRRNENARARSGRAAFAQFTSGSTSAPKGVLVGHAHLAANCAAIRRDFEVTAADVCVSWLPQYHDMGLVGTSLVPLTVDVPAERGALSDSIVHAGMIKNGGGPACACFSPVAFARDPCQWALVASRVGATMTQAPNFAFALLAERWRKLAPFPGGGGRVLPAEASVFDFGGEKTSASASGSATPPPFSLAAMRHALCAAERVRPETLERFAAVFEPHGLRRGAVKVGYGLAESVAYVCVGDAFDAPASDGAASDTSEHFGPRRFEGRARRVRRLRTSPARGRRGGDGRRRSSPGWSAVGPRRAVRPRVRGRLHPRRRPGDAEAARRERRRRDLGLEPVRRLRVPPRGSAEHEWRDDERRDRREDGERDRREDDEYRSDAQRSDGERVRRSTRPFKRGIVRARPRAVPSHGRRGVPPRRVPSRRRAAGGPRRPRRRAERRAGGYRARGRSSRGARPRSARGRRRVRSERRPLAARGRRDGGRRSSGVGLFSLGTLRRRRRRRGGSGRGVRSNIRVRRRRHAVGRSAPPPLEKSPSRRARERRSRGRRGGPRDSNRAPKRRAGRAADRAEDEQRQDQTPRGEGAVRARVAAAGRGGAAGRRDVRRVQGAGRRRTTRDRRRFGRKKRSPAATRPRVAPSSRRSGARAPRRASRRASFATASFTSRRTRVGRTRRPISCPPARSTRGPPRR